MLRLRIRYYRLISIPAAAETPRQVKAKQGELRLIKPFLQKLHPDDNAPARSHLRARRSALPIRRRQSAIGKVSDKVSTLPQCPPEADHETVRLQERENHSNGLTVSRSHALTLSPSHGAHFVDPHSHFLLFILLVHLRRPTIKSGP